MYVYINKSMKSCSFNISNYSVFYTNTGPSKTLFVWTDLFLDEAKKKKKKKLREIWLILWPCLTLLAQDTV